MKKRVLQLIGSFNRGGSESQAVALARMLHREGSFKVFVATLNARGGLRPEIDDLGLPEITEYPLTSFYDSTFVRQTLLFAQYLRQQKIDLLHTHDFYTNIFGMAAAALCKIPARITSKRETEGMRTAVQRFVENIALNRSDSIVVNALAVREHLTERGIAAHKVKLIYNGVDTSRFREHAKPRDQICSEFGLPTNGKAKYVVMVANLRHDVKNVPMLLRTAQRVLDSVPNTHFVVAGEGELESALRASAFKAGVGQSVHFLGACADVPGLLSLADACVLTSYAEGFSNSVLEYMAAGKAVVATNVGGAAEAIDDGSTGYLTPSDDDQAMAARLITLLREPSRANAFGKAGSVRAEKHFSLDRQLADTLSLYSSLLRDSG